MSILRMLVTNRRNGRKYNRPWVRFTVITSIIVGISISHLYIIGNYSTIYLGIPLWAWVQLCILGVMLGLAAIASKPVLPEEEV